MPSWKEMNEAIIKEFRENGGKVGGYFEGAPLLLLTTTGARTGKSRITPLMYLADEENLAIFASKGGSPENPDWYHNLLANPIAVVEVGEERFQARAEIAEGGKLDRLYSKQASIYPQFAEYQENTTRAKIPVVVLRRSA